MQILPVIVEEVTIVVEIFGSAVKASIKEKMYKMICKTLEI